MNADILKIAYREAIRLEPFSKKIEVAGSIRRKKPDPRDVDIVLIPKNKRRIMAYAKMHRTGKIGHGAHHLSYIADGAEVELYFATPKSWGAMLMYATGTMQYNILLRKYAKFFGMKLSQYGLYKDGKMIAGKTEESIYAALGKKWKDPKKRGLFVTNPLSSFGRPLRP